jgi:UDP-GlcNAc:undecaprenyl-phosphate GlcNAc-1-phosphate transferase
VTFPFALITALIISMALIPLLIRFAPRLGMVDMPDPRKVHARPIPRVGGIGIVIGTVVSVLVWIPAYGWVPSYLVGALVLLLFGAWDDSRELGHYVKFIGQFIAAAAVVYWGDLWVAHFPFVSGDLHPAFGKPFTVVAIVGMINAINHSDGLDGLAGGESLLSLGCLAYLGYLAGGLDFVIVVGAVIGGVFGFLRYNTYPARVFMGDSGSQFLGFSLAVLAVRLTQQINPGLSMAVPALILGLPIFDILAVLAQRVYQGMNWFRATKNHVHHRLLALGYQHYQAVVIIYAVQAFFVLSAILFRYESDLLVLGTYIGGCALVFVLLALAEQRGWQVRQGVRSSHGVGFSGSVVGKRLSRLPLLVVQITVPAFLILASLWVGKIPVDSGIASIAIATVTLAGMLLYRSVAIAPTLIRLGVFSAGALLIYLVERNATGIHAAYANFYVAYFVVMAVAIGTAIRIGGESEFRTTPLDYLLVGLVIAAGFLARGQLPGLDLGAIIMPLVVLFYGCELIVNRSSAAWVGAMSLSALLATLIVVLRYTFGG